MIRIALAVGSAACMIGCAASSAASVQPSTASSMETTLAYTLREVCLPYVSNGKSDSLVGLGASVTRVPGQSAFKQFGLESHAIGKAGQVHVGAGLSNGKRLCLVQVNHHSSTNYKPVVDHVLLTLPVAFILSKSQQLPYYTDYCAPSPSPLIVTVDFGSNAVSKPNQTSIFMIGYTKRSPGCDDPNYHPLIIAPPR
jgi:hypothetical protein